jgi:hypothetical protein
VDPTGRSRVTNAHDPDAQAIARRLAVEPRLHGFERTSRAVGLGRNELLERARAAIA